MTSYAGIGARATPQEVLSSIRKAAKFLARKDVILRTGGAKGADTAFYEGWSEVSTKPSVEVFIPYEGFNKFTSNSKTVFGPPSKEARQIARNYHPNWGVLGDRGRDFMARNVYQVLGRDLVSPCNFVLCYTHNGKVVGGTGQALRIAADHNIPVFNFGCMSLDEISEQILEIIA